MQEFFAKHQIKAQKIAVAVSGGADSLALVFMAKEQLSVFGFEVVALTVNHHLRPNSSQEAAYVARLMKTHGIAHHVLDWISKKPESAIEEEARKARYKLLTEWCHHNNVKILLTAHHRNDQAETFLMRLERGSGLKGLCCMREISENNGIIIARPLLNTPPENMRKYLNNRHIKWIEDESNTDSRYLRNKIRAFLPQFEQATGITPQTLADTAFRLQSAEEYISTQTKQTISAQVQTITPDVYCFRYSDFIAWHREIKFRIFAELCGHDYIPRAEHILAAIEAVSKLPFAGLTLGGKEIFKAYDNIWIVPELHAKRKPSRALWKEYVQKNPQYHNLKIPHKARVAILAQTGESL